jgi:hypothetical protein
MQNWLAEWYCAKPNPAKHCEEYASEDLTHFLGEMRLSVSEKFEGEFLPGLRLHLHDGLANTSECQSRAVHAECRQFCSTWIRTQEDDRQQLSVWICE